MNNSMMYMIFIFNIHQHYPKSSI